MYGIISSSLLNEPTVVTLTGWAPCLLLRLNRQYALST
jgi:hypothetical protein